MKGKLDILKNANISEFDLEKTVKEIENDIKRIKNDIKTIQGYTENASAEPAGDQTLRCSMFGGNSDRVTKDLQSFEDCFAIQKMIDGEHLANVIK